MQMLTQLAPLSARETEVLRELGRGKSNLEIGHALHLSVGSVKGYLSSIMKKWKARDRVQVVVFAATAGLIRFD